MSGAGAGAYRRVPSTFSSSVSAYYGDLAKSNQAPAPKKEPSPAGPRKLSAKEKLGEANYAATLVDTVVFPGWGKLNALGFLTTELTFDPKYPSPVLATTGVPAATNALLEPIGLLDTANTLMSTLNAVWTSKEKSDTHKKAKKERWNDGMAEFAYVNASGARREAKSNAKRTVPGFARDVLGGLVGAASRMKTLIGGDSLFGANAGNASDYAFGGTSCVTYLVAGLAQSEKIDNAAGRVYGVNRAAHNAINAAQGVSEGRNTRGVSSNKQTIELDQMYERHEISANVYGIVRARPQGDIDSFVQNWSNLDVQGKERLAKLMHFSGAYHGRRVFDLSRTTNLNTPAVRRAAREVVLDVFVKTKIKPEWKSGDDGTLHESVADLLDDAKVARKEAIGAKLAPNIVYVKNNLERRNIKLDENVVRAIARSNCAEKFLDAYENLVEQDRYEGTNHEAELQKILHFDSWRFWRRDATLPTTKYQRADIRQALVKRFADGASLKELKTLKVRYNQKVVPLRTARTHAGPAVDDVMVEHILAAQDAKLDALKEEKRDAKVKVIYGLGNGLAAVAESAVNPAAATGVSATRAILSAPYLFYAARRGLGSLLGQKNAVPVAAGLREDALLSLLPEAQDAIEQYSNHKAGSPGFIGGLKDHVYFLNKEFNLTAEEIKKLDALENAGKDSSVRALLIRRKPEANILIALRRSVEGDPRFRTPKEVDAEYDRLKAAVLYPAVHPTSVIERQERTRITQVERSPLKGKLLNEQVREATAQRCRKLAQDNPILATRMFVDELLSPDETVAARARGMLREFRFSEREIWGLTKLGKDTALGGKGERRAVADALQDHLLGEGLRRRFSTRKLDKGRRNAAKILAAFKTQDDASKPKAGRNASVQTSPELLRAAPKAGDEPLRWRYDLEIRGINTIDNAGAPGLDSMLHALQQHFVGNTNYSSNPLRRREMRQRLVSARQRVLAEMRSDNRQPGGAASTAPNDIDNNVMANIDRIVEIAAEEFGKPGATVIVMNTDKRGTWQYVGANPAGPREVAAVVCFDSQTQRTFALDGADPEELKRARRQPPPKGAQRPAQGAANAL